MLPPLVDPRPPQKERCAAEGESAQGVGGFNNPVWESTGSAPPSPLLPGILLPCQNANQTCVRSRSDCHTVSPRPSRSSRLGYSTDPGAAPCFPSCCWGGIPVFRWAPRSFQKATLLPHEVMKLARCSPLWRQGAAEDSASLWDWSQYGGFCHTFQSFHTQYKCEQ